MITSLQDVATEEIIIKHYSRRIFSSLNEYKTSKQGQFTHCIILSPHNDK
jgi:hypothetical protein